MTEGRILRQQETQYLNPDWTLARVQHDAPSYAGNSGGPLILDNGLVASVHTRGNLTKATGSGTSVVHLREMLDTISKRGYRGGLDVSTDAGRYHSFGLSAYSR